MNQLEIFDSMIAEDSERAGILAYYRKLARVNKFQAGWVRGTHCILTSSPLLGQETMTAALLVVCSMGWHILAKAYS